MQAFFKFFFARRSACYFLDLKINRESQIVTTGGADTATPALGGGHGLVWVNTETHVYHKDGSCFYGTTKKGNYVSAGAVDQECAVLQDNDPGKDSSTIL
jgi:hypothetical protein